MSNELQIPTSPDITVYALVHNAVGKVWSVTGSAFVTLVDANWANYAITMTEQGTSSGYYYGDFPTAITIAGNYNVSVYQRVGGTPVVGDTLLGADVFTWDGTAEALPSTGNDLTTLSFVKTFMAITDTSVDGPLTQLITNKSIEVIGYLGYNPRLQSYTEVRCGNGGNWIRTESIPITAISQVTFDNDYSTTSVVPGSEFLYESETGIVKFKPQSSYWRVFDDRFQNLKLEYSAGYSTVPADLQEAIAQLCAISLYKHSWNFLGVIEKSVGDVRIRYGDVTITAGNETLYLDGAYATLNRYKMHHERYT